MILFQNPGELSPLAITTFGLNAKPNSQNPIGYFGTGLKYAIATLLREGCTIEILSGERSYTFFKQDENFRGTDFSSIWMREKPFGALALEESPEHHRLGFTTELGRNWLPWMAYRELWANAGDEDGTIDKWPDFTAIEPEPGQTKIIVKGLDQVHDERGEFLLLTQPLYRSPVLEIHPGQGSKIFFRGICVGKLEKPTVMRYNFLRPMKLTEDRTLAEAYMVDYYLKQFFAEELRDEALCERIITAPKGTLEFDLNFNEANPTPEFLEAAGRHLTNLRCNVSARGLFKALTKKTLSPRNDSLSPVRKAALERAIAFCHRLGFQVSDYEIVYVEALGQGIVGLAEEDRIYLSELAFSGGTKIIAATLIEEFLHLRHGLHDQSRAMQNFLFERIVSLGEEIQGSPL